MSELTLTLLRLGLLALLWIFVFSVVGVLRTDIYGTTVSRRSQRRAQRQQEKAQQRARPVQPAAAPQPSKRSRGKKVPTTLVVTEGPLAGTSLPLRQSGVLIGRNPECALVLDDDYASGRHCRIYPSGEGWFVEDLGSTNGTYMGRDKLTSPRPVEVGSSLRIGKTVIELRG
jgi:pSer/pThr/pTyr-binding forkhead associated (FHA) protein